ncbi:hypothetical protein MRB53_009677 [Persea americana]|uniref:Uncharacterized protein n=1 Tax=Persea americana TaxID=3435 RepID=A0ACC2LPW9_PERAE|nr:hypothetical protein MRB53_009677 [Persea americana]
MTGGNQSPTTKRGGEYEGMVMMGNGNEVSTTRTGDYRKNGNMMSEADKVSASKTEKDVGRSDTDIGTSRATDAEATA